MSMDETKSNQEQSALPIFAERLHKASAGVSGMGAIVRMIADRGSFGGEEARALDAVDYLAKSLNEEIGGIAFELEAIAEAT